MKNSRVNLLTVLMLISGFVSAQTYTFKVENCGYYFVFTDRNPMQMIDRCFQNDSLIDCVLVEPSKPTYEINLDSMVFLTDGVITSRILEVYQDSINVIAIKYQFVGSDKQGYVALRENSHGKAVYCGLYIYDSNLYSEGAMATGELKVNEQKLEK